MSEKAPVLFKSPTVTNRLAAEVLPQGSWLGRPAFLIGGGPSLEGFDFGRLRGRRTIGVNRAYEHFDPTITFSMDTRFLHWILGGSYGEEAKRRFEAQRGYRIWLLTYTATLPGDILVAPVFKNYDHGRTHLSWNIQDGLGHGCNSGAGALNLALILGANPIYLLGFDMKHKGGKTHYHGGHPLKQSQSQLDTMRPIFEKWAPEIAARGIRVVNLNPDSAIRCFEFGNREEATA